MAPVPEKEGSVPTRLLIVDDTLLLEGHRYPEAPYLRSVKYGSYSNSCVTCYDKLFCSKEQHSIRLAPWVTVLAAAMEAAMTGTRGMLFVPCLLLVFWLSSLRGVRSCGVAMVLASCLGLSFLTSAL